MDERMNDIEKMVNDALALSEDAKTEEARRNAEKQRDATMEEIHELIAHCGKWISILKSYDKASR